MAEMLEPALERGQGLALQGRGRQPLYVDAGLRRRRRRHRRQRQHGRRGRRDRRPRACLRGDRQERQIGDYLERLQQLAPRGRGPGRRSAGATRRSTRRPTSPRRSRGPSRFFAACRICCEGAPRFMPRAGCEARESRAKSFPCVDFFCFDTARPPSRPLAATANARSRERASPTRAGSARFSWRRA